MFNLSDDIETHLYKQNMRRGAQISLFKSFFNKQKYTMKIETRLVRSSICHFFYRFCFSY